LGALRLLVDPIDPIDPIDPVDSVGGVSVFLELPGLLRTVLPTRFLPMWKVSMFLELPRLTT